jgi:hypothetical protein
MQFLSSRPSTPIPFRPKRGNTLSMLLSPLDPEVKPDDVKTKDTPAVNLSDIKAALNGAPSSAPEVATANVHATPAVEETKVVREAKAANGSTA